MVSKTALGTHTTVFTHRSTRTHTHTHTHTHIHTQIHLIISMIRWRKRERKGQAVQGGREQYVSVYERGIEH